MTRDTLKKMVYDQIEEIESGHEIIGGCALFYLVDEWAVDFLTQNKQATEHVLNMMTQQEVGEAYLKSSFANRAGRELDFKMAKSFIHKLSMECLEMKATSQEEELINS